MPLFGLPYQRGLEPDTYAEHQRRRQIRKLEAAPANPPADPAPLLPEPIVPHPRRPIMYNDYVARRDNFEREVAAAVERELAAAAAGPVAEE